MPVIYKITFSNADFYIGQTSNFERRKASHLNTKGRGSPKLEHAFLTQGTPEFSIVEEIEESLVDIKEQYYIDKLNPTLNTLPGGKVLRGLNHPRSKYSKEQVREVVNLFLNTVIKYSDIAVLTDVQTAMVHDICKRRAHTWATENVSDEQLTNARLLRRPKYCIYDKYNNKWEAESAEKLAEICDLQVTSIRSLMASKKGVSRAGWSVYPHQYLYLKDPLGKEYEVTAAEAKDLIATEVLSTFQKTQLLKGKDSAGWVAKILAKHTST